MVNFVFGLMVRASKSEDQKNELRQNKDEIKYSLNVIFGLIKKVLYFVLALVIAGAVILIIAWAISPNEAPKWTGFGESISAKGEVQPAKTLWDWMDLLIVSLVIAVGVFLLNQSARRRERDIQEKRTIQEKQKAADQQRQQAFEKYLDAMGKLLTEHNLQSCTYDEPARVIARARTLEALRSMGWVTASGVSPEAEKTFTNVPPEARHKEYIALPDAKRRGAVLKFLYESKLIDREEPVVDLAEAELEHADLNKANLKKSRLSGCSLMEANLEEADLGQAELTRANMLWAKLRAANLNKANLTVTYLRWTDLSHSSLQGANLARAFLAGADLRYADMEEAILQDADLSDAKLAGTTLYKANLRGANLNGAIVEEPMDENMKSILRSQHWTEEKIKDYEQSSAKSRRVYLKDAVYDKHTKWPDAAFDPAKFGAKEAIEVKVDTDSCTNFTPVTTVNSLEDRLS